MSAQEFGVQRVHPPRHANVDPGPYGGVQIFASKAQADFWADHFNPDTYRVLVRDVSEWRES